MKKVKTVSRNNLFNAKTTYIQFATKTIFDVKDPNKYFTQSRLKNLEYRLKKQNKKILYHGKINTSFNCFETKINNERTLSKGIEIRCLCFLNSYSMEHLVLLKYFFEIPILFLIFNESFVHNKL